MYGLEYATKNIVVIMTTNSIGITREDMRNLIIRLDLPQTILELYDETCTDPILKKNGLLTDYSYPDMILCLNKEQQDVYQTDIYKPFLSSYSETIFAYDEVSKGYIRYSVEYFKGKINSLTWDGLFVREILSWWEFEINDDDILYIGNLFGLKHTKNIISELYIAYSNGEFKTFEKTEIWINAMIDKIDGRIA